MTEAWLNKYRIQSSLAYEFLLHRGKLKGQWGWSNLFSFGNEYRFHHRNDNRIRPWKDLKNDTKLYVYHKMRDFSFVYPHTGIKENAAGLILLFSLIFFPGMIFRWDISHHVKHTDSHYRRKWPDCEGCPLSRPILCELTKSVANKRLN